MSTIEFWIWRDGERVVLSDGERRLAFRNESDATDAAVRIAQEVEVLYRITYARHVAD